MAISRYKPTLHRWQGLATDLETKNDVAPYKTSPSVRCSTFHLATLMVKGSDLLLDRESCKMEYKAPNLEEGAPCKLEPQHHVSEVLYLTFV